MPDSERSRVSTTFRARTAKKVLAWISQELGPNAVILGPKRDGSAADSSPWQTGPTFDFGLRDIRAGDLTAASARLAGPYEEKGEREEAGRRYEKFLGLWKHAEAGCPEVVEARMRLARLKGGG